jgi:hypothetical protein
LAIVRGAFSQLLRPGLRAAIANAYPGKVWFVDEDDIREIERQDEMALLHPDTSAIPIWRRRPTRVEHPMEAWRAWGMEIVSLDRPVRGKYEPFKIDAYLKSVAADCNWEGPVLRSHKRPVDPKYWDSIREKRTTDPEEYYSEMHDTFELAGVWAVKTKEGAVSVASTYGVSTYGRIKMWGRVAQFKLGYRAEACIIDELWVIVTSMRRMFEVRNDARDDQQIFSRIQQIVKALENRYQCKVNLDNTPFARR